MVGDRGDLMEDKEDPLVPSEGDKEDLPASSEEADLVPALTPLRPPAGAPFDRPLADLPSVAPEEIALCFTPARWCRA